MQRRQPLYMTIKQGITDALREGRWRHGQRIPSEPQLAKRFGASVGTVRKAVGELVGENILVRTQGSGTYVASHTRDYMLNVFFRIARKDGRKELPQGRVLAFARARAERDIARRLSIPAGSAVYRVRSLLELHGTPTIVDDMRLPVRLFPGLTGQIMSERDGTVFGMFQSRYGITVVRTEEFITAGLADAQHAALLGIAAGAPILEIRRVTYTDKEQPVETRLRRVSCANHGYLSVLGKQG